MRNWIRNNRGLLIFLLLFGVFRTTVADWNPIPSGSMRPTLLEGDVVFVNRLAFDFKIPLTQVALLRLGEPRRGDLVTFFSPEDGIRLIKRVIGLPGDVVEMRNKMLIVNGQAATYTPLGEVRERVSEWVEIDAMRLVESYDEHDHSIQWLYPARSRIDSFGPIEIPPDHYLMLGDNRDDSADSRYYGLVPRELLIGRAEIILVSADILDQWALRFERFGASLR